MTYALEDVMRLLPTRPRLLAVGEPTHGDNNLLTLRNVLWKHLVEHEGYRTIALESDCLRALTVDDYVTTGVGDLDDVVRDGFSHEWGHFQGNHDLVRWMRSYNDGRPPAEQVRFAGFDGPLEITAAASPRPVVTALAESTGSLAPDMDRLLGDDDRWTNPAAMMDPSQSVGRSPEAKELRLFADDLAARLAMRPHPDERARLYARTATGLLRYHYWMADSSPDRLSWLLGIRDSMMADNLRALADRGPTFVYGHNSHLQRGKSSMRMGGRRLEWWGAGALIDPELGTDYAFVATAVGTIHEHGVPAPPPDSVEGHLYALPQDQFVTRARDLPGARRESPWYGYAPLDPAQLAGVDGVVFVRDVTPIAGASARTGPR